VNKKVSRRTFLKGTALGAAAVMSPAAFRTPHFNLSRMHYAEKRTLNVTTIPGSAGDHLVLSAKNFMAVNPDIDVKVNIAGGAETEYKPAFPQIVASSDKPDFAWYWVDGRQYQDIANAGLLEPLDDLYESEGWNKVLPQSILNTYTSPDGHKYAANAGIVWYPQIYYSKEAFKKAGVEAPKDHYYKSLAEFYDVSDKLRAAGYEPLTIGGKEGWIIGHAHDALLQRVATEEQLNELLTNWRKGSTPKLTYSEPPWLTSNKLLLELQQKNVFAEGFLGRSYPEGRALFVQGKAAMYQDGSWAPSDAVLYKEAPNLDFGWMLYPQVDPKIQPKFLLYGGNGLMIPQGGPNVDIAKKFMTFIMSKDQQTIATKAKVLVSSRNDLPADAIAGAGPHVAEMYPLISTIGASTGWDDPVPADMAERSLILWGDLLSGRIPVEKIGPEIEKVADQHRKG
jgi:glucose/mannose transport system substrate-binding protein